MTLEEAKELAAQGDLGAVCSLGDYYMLDQQDMEEAEKWYEIAAKQDVFYAVHQLVGVERMKALAALMIADREEIEYGWYFAGQDWQKLYDWSLKELNMINASVPGSETVDTDKVFKDLKDTVFHLALCNYEQRNYEKIVSLLKGIVSETREQMLYGSAVFETAETEQDYEYAYEMFQAVVADNNYATATKSRHEETIYVIMTITLAGFYREGLGERGAVPNIEKAVNVLTTIQQNLQNEKAKMIMEAELQHYQKKIFGGYKYIK